MTILNPPEISHFRLQDSALVKQTVGTSLESPLQGLSAIGIRARFFYPIPRPLVATGKGANKTRKVSELAKSAWFRLRNSDNRAKTVVIPPLQWGNGGG